MAFEGWLIKFGNVQLPNSYLLADGWESTPNQRIEIKAWRDANVLLHRDTSSNFQTDRNQRRVNVTYWNDEDLEYKSGIFYISDTTYTIHRIDENNNDIEYNAHTIELTEY